MRTSSLFRKRFIKNFAVIIFWLLVWEIAAVIVGSNIILVSPRMAFARLFSLGQTVEFWRSITVSMWRIMQGFGLALVTGVFIAAASARFKIIYTLILPAINVINAVPIASFIILAFFAMSTARVSIFVPFIMVLPIIFHNTYKGIVNTNHELLEMAGVFRVPYWKKVLYIYIKSAAPYVLAGAQVGIGFAWKSGIAAELIVQARGTIGGSLHVARIHLQTADVFAWTIAIVLLSYSMEKIFLTLFKGLKA